jgi:hypothetical protein
MQLLDKRLAKESAALPKFMVGSHWQAETSTIKELHKWYVHACAYLA